MKILFLFILIVVALIWKQTHGEQHNSVVVNESAYSNTQFQYEIDRSEKFKIDDSVLELVLLSSQDARLRINAGCYAFGLEGLLQSSEVTQIDQIPALKESYYSDSVLRLIRYVMTAKGKCFALELSATTSDGWMDAEKLARSFRLTD